MLDGSDLPLAAVRQVESLMWEKANRTPVQREIDSRLLHARQMVRDEEVAPGVIYDRLPVELGAVDAPAERPPELLPSEAGGSDGNDVP